MNGDFDLHRQGETLDDIESQAAASPFTIIPFEDLFGLLDTASGVFDEELPTSMKHFDIASGAVVLTGIGQEVLKYLFESPAVESSFETLALYEKTDLREERLLQLHRFSDQRADIDAFGLKGFFLQEDGQIFMQLRNGLGAFDQASVRAGLLEGGVGVGEGGEVEFDRRQRGIEIVDKVFNKRIEKFDAFFHGAKSSLGEAITQKSEKQKQYRLNQKNSQDQAPNSLLIMPGGFSNFQIAVLHPQRNQFDEKLSGILKVSDIDVFRIIVEKAKRKFWAEFSRRTAHFDMAGIFKHTELFGLEEVGTDLLKVKKARQQHQKRDTEEIHEEKL